VECSVTCSRVVNVPMGVYGYGGSAATPIPFDSSPRLNLTLVIDQLEVTGQLTLELISSD
jgi:hypothetical protein